MPDRKPTENRRETDAGPATEGVNAPLTPTAEDRAMRMVPALLLLAACGASPAPDMFGSVRSEVTRGGVDFVVFQTGSEVEVVRMGYLTRPARARVPALMAEAAEVATGCRVIANSMTTKIPGDTGVARFALDCRG